MTVLGLYGGAFDPPHRGHVALAARAQEALGLERLIVLVAADPEHKRVETPAAARLAMAQAAFPDAEVVLDEHGRTIETLRAHPEWQDAVFLVGADQFADFLAWKEPEAVLERVSLGVATRPGYPQERLAAVLERLDRPDRVRFFELEPVPVASRELRELAADGVPLGGDVPSAVADIIRREGLYVDRAG